MAKVSFSVPGIPVGKQRVIPRAGGKSFTPKETRAYEKLIWDCFRTTMRGPIVPHTGPVIIRFTAIFPIPKSWPPAAKDAAARGQMYHLAKPDKENIEKAIWDALSPPAGRKGAPTSPEGYPWHNDSQCMGGGIKRHGSPPRLDVTIEFIEQPGGIMSPAEARREEKNIVSEQRRKSGSLGRVLPPHNAPTKKSPRGDDTPLGRAIAAAIAKEAQEPGK